MKIHKTALVHPEAKIGDDVEIGPYTIIDKKVTIANGTIIGPKVVIEGTTSIGKNCKIYTGAIIGTPPQDLKYKGEETKVSIGDNNVIREYATINRGTVAKGETKLGNNNLIMAYAHIAHDCSIGNNTILANVATLAGHVVIEDKAIVGGITPVHQFVRIGTMSIVGGASRTTKDIPPYCKAAGSPIRMFGLNSIALERSNFSEEVKSQLKMAYKIVFKSKLNTTQAIEKLEKESDLCDEVRHFITFIKGSERGICKE